MRVTKGKKTEVFEGDMTPLIDMVFQLIAFFMVLINFTEAEVDSRVVLPSSVLAKPPQKALEKTLTIQMTKDGTALMHGDDLDTKTQLPGRLLREVRRIGGLGQSVKDTTVIVRAHREAPTGKVQEVIEACQEKKFEIFRLRAEEDLRDKK